MRRRLKRRAGADRGCEGALVEVIEFAADRHPVGKPRHRDTSIAEQIGDVVRGGLAVDRGVEGEDELFDLRRMGTRDQRVDRQICGRTPSSGDSVPPSTW